MKIKKLGRKDDNTALIHSDEGVEDKLSESVIRNMQQPDGWG
jgi:hypothetical protein